MKMNVMVTPELNIKQLLLRREELIIYIRKHNRHYHLVNFCEMPTQEIRRIYERIRRQKKEENGIISEI